METKETGNTKIKKIHKSSKAEQIFNFTINQIDEK